MAIGEINPGYMGIATIGGVSTRFTDANITARQEVNAPDLIMGSYDRMAWVYGKVEIGGSISGPITEKFASGGSGVWAWATERLSCGELNAKSVVLQYYCAGKGGNSGRTFGGMYVNSMTVSAAAGDVAQFSVDVMGVDPPSWSGTGAPLGEEKLVTWDAIAVTAPGITEPISNFEITINNNLEAVYAISPTATYYPFDVVPGLRTVSGTISTYNVPAGTDGADGYGDGHGGGAQLIGFNLGGLAVQARVAYHRVEPSSSVGPIVSTIGFTGVGIQPF